MFKKKILIAVAAVSVVVGCSSIPTDLDDARDSAERAQEEADRVSETGGRSVLDEAGPELTAQEENVLNNVDTVREDCPLDGKPYADSDGMRQKRSALYQCETGHPRVADQLDGFDEAKRSHSRYVDARQYVERLEGKIAEWQQELEDIREASEEDRALYGEYQGFFDGPQDRAIRLLFTVKNDELSSRFAPPHVISDRVEAALSLDDREQRCRDEFDVDRDFAPYAEEDHRNPSNACEIVYNWRDYMETYLNLHAQDRAESERDELERMIDRVGGDGVTTDGNRSRLADIQAERDELNGFYQAYMEQIDGQLTETTMEKIDAMLPLQSVYDDTLAESGQQMRWRPEGLHEEQEVRSALDSVFRTTDQTIHTYGVSEGDWNIEHSPAGAPVARYHHGAVVTQEEGEDFCRIYNYTAAGEFDGTDYTAARIRMRPYRDIYTITACP